MSIAGEKEGTIMSSPKQDLWDKLAPAAEALMRLLKVDSRLPTLYTRVQLAFLLLEGPSPGVDRAHIFLRDALAKTLVALLLAAALGLASGDAALLVGMLVLCAALPALLYLQLNKRIEAKRRSVITELPELLNQLVLLVNAGETVQQALQKCGSRIPEDPAQRSALDRELAQLVQEMANQVSLPVALENFSRRCGVQEVSLFSNTILLNYRRGGDEFVTSLRELNRGLWERRKAQAKTLGEEASSKLVFPMVLIFLIVTVIVAAPAIFMMQF
jgi:tight adherence protein C